jgi:hypothetical protein
MNRAKPSVLIVKVYMSKVQADSKKQQRLQNRLHRHIGREFQGIRKVQECRQTPMNAGIQ